MVFKRLFAKVLRIPRHLRMIFYIRYNRLKFWLNRVEMGRNMLVYNSVYLRTKHQVAVSVSAMILYLPVARRSIHYVVTYGDAFIQPTRLRTFSSVMIRGSRRPAYGLIHLLLLETT